MNKKKNKMIIATTAVIVVAVVILGTFSYLGFFKQEEKAKKEEMPEVQIDDRISPLLNQGLTVQIKRIRNRGLMDKMLTFGTSWKNKPTFYWICTVDGREHNLAEVEAAGGVKGSGVFTAWDTFGEESKGVFYVEEEQQTSEITIVVMEQVKSGLFGRKTEDVEKETIALTYDYRIGHWNGDDYLKDDDGYGHVRGEEYEIWFDIKQSDYDHDGIPYWTEVNLLGTNPTVDDSNADVDNDGCSNFWEWKWGYNPIMWDDHLNLDPDIDGIENIEEYKMSKWLSDPYQPDIYIEIDGMEKGRLLDWNHVSYEESHQMLMERFAQHGINVYIDYGWPDGPINGGGELLPFIETLSCYTGHHHNKFYVHNFADERKGIFRYCIVANNAGFISPGDYNYFDHLVVDSPLRKTFFKPRWGSTPRYFRVLIAKGILHEMGHSMGLQATTFYGVDILSNDKDNRWPTELTDEEYDKYCDEYYSIMNYDYIFGLAINKKKLFDYSDGSNGAPYDQNDWAYLYLPAFQYDAAAFEESPPSDNSFEDQEYIDKKPGIIIEGWELNENLTDKYQEELSQLSFVYDNDCTYQIFTRKDAENVIQESNRTVRAYARPNVEPTFVRWSLVAEGNLDSEGGIQFNSEVCSRLNEGELY